MGDEQVRGDDEPTRVDDEARPEVVPEDIPTVVETPAPAAPVVEPVVTRDETPTRAETPTRPRSVHPAAAPSEDTGLSDLGSASATTLRQTLHAQDAERSRSFTTGTLAVALAIALPLPLLGGDPTAKAVFAVSLGLLVIVSVYTGRRLSDPSGYSMELLMRGAVFAIAAAFCGIFYFGAFSPAVVVVPFGLYFFGLAQSFRYTLAIYAACSAVYAAMALPVALQWLPNHGLVQPDGLTVAEGLTLVFAVEVVFFATYSVSRFSRRAAERALADHDRAVREIAGRDALLQEARLDLEGVLRARGLGRFTDEVVGGFRLGRILGRGGMGEVYEAVQVDSEEPAAVKLLHPHILDDEQAVRRFFRECTIASSLDVPNVVKVLSTSTEDDAIPFIAMERLRGEDLSDYLRSHGRMKPRDVVRLVRQVGRGLDAARDAGIVHRDLKPRNLFSAQVGESTEGIWKILDFGVSKLAGEATMTGKHLVGTPSYMAPEQAEGGEVTHATDLYALGVIAYRALTGRPAFSGETPAAILYQVVREMPPAPSHTGSHLPEAVDDVLAVAMAKDPADRFESAHALADALEQALRPRVPSELRRHAAQVRQRHPWGA